MAGARTKLSVALTVGAALTAASPALAESIGCLHVPSTMAQYLGYGYGAGRHAPIVHTPGHRPAPIPRRATAPRCYGPMAPAAYAPIGCYDGACYGVPYGAALGAPIAAPAAVPGPAAYRPAAPYGSR